MSAAASTLAELRQRVEQMQGRPAAQPIATHPAFSGLLQLHAGSSYAIDSMSLALALLAGPSADGAWCAVVGSDQLGFEAAAAAGVELSRTIVVPDPGEAWLEVVAALVDVLQVVLLCSPVGAAPRDVSRLSARLRQRGAVLLVHGPWPRSDAQVSLRDVEWVGVGQGHGHLVARQATVEVRKGTAPPRRGRVWLPDEAQVIRRVDQPAAQLRSVS